ncbi:MAG: hypothetical protein LKJ76_08305 [Lachnospiraceae bacterium]|jgi:hypothetical protein|nr:hypothetical protein [Lachnospiraceae bacterium]
MAGLKGFSVVSTKVKKQAEMSLVFAQSGLHFSKDTADLLGKPSFVRIMINTASSQAAIQACRKDCEGAVRFCKVYGETHRGRKPKDPEAAAKKAAELAEKPQSINIKTPAVVNALGKYLKIDDDKTIYTLIGEFNAEQKAIVYDLKTVEVDQRNPRGRKKGTVLSKDKK